MTDGEIMQLPAMRIGSEERADKENLFFHIRGVHACDHQFYRGSLVFLPVYILFFIEK